MTLRFGMVCYAPASPRAPLAPRRGFETVTYMIDGILRHQDSNGGGELITDRSTASSMVWRIGTSPTSTTRWAPPSTPSSPPPTPCCWAARPTTTTPRNSEQLQGDLVEAVTALKQQPGEANIAMSGSISVVRQLLAAGLLDELRLLVHPVAVRRGRRPFDEGERPIPLRLLSSEAFSTGVLKWLDRLDHSWS